MASPQKAPPKQTSRWGFLQQAVASVESRLDTILAEEDTPKKAVPTQLAKENATPKRPSGDLSRSNSGTQANDRLQQRLARAMAKKNASATSTPAPPSETTSAAPSPTLPPADSSVTTSLDIDRSGDEDSKSAAIPTSVPLPQDAKPDTPDAEVSLSTEQLLPPSTALHPPSSTGGLDVASGSTGEENNLSSQKDADASTAAVGARTAPVVEDNNNQEEINSYVERIDALQAKLQYLTREAAEAAKQAAAAAQTGSAEKKLLEKDEKIALLMEEGQKLSKTEMKHVTTIRRMRSQAVAAVKEQEDLKARAEQAYRNALTMEERAKRAEAASKRAEESLATSLSANRNFDAVSRERDALTATLAEMKGQLSRANARADSAEAKAQANLAEKERRRNEELQDDLTSAKVERELSEEKLRREVGDLKAALEREREHCRVMETEMLGEQATLESKLESFRSRVEEVSSNNQGDVQAKLLRQIETLQSQYAAASQNWQVIEGSLLSRITNVERERDDAATREGEVRKKIRDLTLKAKNADRQAEINGSRAVELERQLPELEKEIQKLSKAAKEHEEALSKAQNDLDEHRNALEKEISKRIEEEKAKWVASLPARNESPSASIRKGTGFDMGHLMSPVYPVHGRRASGMHGIDSNTPPRQQSATMLPSLANGKGLFPGAIPETPSIVTSPEHEEYFNSIPPTPASTRGGSGPANRGVNDIISTSTVGAGPSVQLVERMSANVRRLESEKAASKDELARLQTQRDEARSEIVKLMKEVEQTRSQGRKLTTLEDEHDTLRKRYEATLEMLGEKSELVEELKADVADVKEMYRELVDTMGRTK